MRSNNSLFIFLLCGMLFALSATSFTGYAPTNILLASSILLSLTGSMRNAFAWTVGGAIVGETVSPFPALAFSAALFCALAVTNLFVKHIITHRTFIAAAALGAVSAVIFEILLYVFSRLGVLFGTGWIPHIDHAYIVFFTSRSILTASLVTIAFLIAQRFSPRVRGVLILPR